MNKCLLMLSMIMLMLQSAAFGQSEEATTISGKKVILYPDGTWKYAGETKSKEKQPGEDKKKVTDKKPMQGEPVIAADCADFLEIIEDQRTGIRATRIRNMIIVAEPDGKKEISIMLQKGVKGVITMTLRSMGAGECVAEGNKINIVFTDGSKTDLANEAYTNCRGESTVNFGAAYGRKKILEDLRSKKIKTIRVWTQQGSVQESLSPGNQEEFNKMLNCLVAQN